MRCTFLLGLPILLLSLQACSDFDQADGSTATLCEQASEHVDHCFGTGLDECTDEIATRLLATDCDGILTSLDPAGKADGFCPSFLWWLCGSVSDPTCPSDYALLDYPQLGSAQQLDVQWRSVLCTEYDVPPSMTTSTWTVLSNGVRAAATSLFRLERAFTNETDFLDRGRRKLLHPYGSVAQVTWVRAEVEPTCGDYSGLFAEPSLLGLARMGWGADPAAGGYIPGIAVKFFVEGQDSVNLHLINSLDADPDAPNFFAKTLSNVIPEPEGRVIRGFIRLASYVVDNPLELTVDDMAAWTAAGTLVSQPVSPRVLAFEPTAEAFERYDIDLDFRDAFASYPVATPLYDAYVVDGECRQALGTLYTSSRLVASEWGDNRLHFQHQQGGQGL